MGYYLVFDWPDNGKTNIKMSKMKQAKLLTKWQNVQHFPVSISLKLNDFTEAGHNHI